MSIWRRKILRDLWLYRSRTSLVMLTIVIGVFAVGTTARSWVLLARNLNQSYLATNPAHGVVTVQGTFDDSLVQTIAKLEHIEAVEARYVMSVRARPLSQRSLQPMNGEWRTLRLMVLPDFDIQLNKPRWEAGAWPPPRQTMLLERQSFDYLGLNVNALKATSKSPDAELPVLIELPNGKQRTINVSGQVHDISQMPSNLAGTAYAYSTQGTLQRLNGIQGYNTLLFTTKERTAVPSLAMVRRGQRSQLDLQQVAVAVIDTIEAEGHIVVRKDIFDEDTHPLYPIIETVLFLLSTLGALSLLLSTFLVINIVSALLARQLKEIGAMKTIGGGSGQIQGIYLEMILAIGLLAIFLAIPLATVGATALSGILAELFNIDITDIHIPVGVYGLDWVAGIGIPTIITLIPIRRGVRITVKEALSHSEIRAAEAKSVKSSRAFNLWRLPLPSIGYMPLWVRYVWRNAFRRTERLVLTLSTLAFAGAIFITVIALQSSLDRTINSIEAYWQEDLRVNFSTFERVKNLAAIALSVPEVSDVEGRLQYSGYRVSTDGREGNHLITMLGVPAETPYLQPTLVAGRWLVHEDENALVINIDFWHAESGTGLKEKLTLQDEVVLKFEGRETTWRIVGIVTTQLAGGGGFRSSFAYANASYLSTVMRDVNKANRLVIELDKGALKPYVISGPRDPTWVAYQTEQKWRIEDAFKRAGFFPKGMGTQAGRRDDVRNNFSILIMLLFIMSLLFAVVAGLGLMGTMSLNVLERTREFGVVRSFGATNMTIAQIVVGEGICIGLISWFFGTLLARPISQMLSYSIGVLFLGTPLDYTFPLHGIFLWLGLSILLAVIASYFPAREILKLQVREALANE